MTVSASTSPAQSQVLSTGEFQATILLEKDSDERTYLLKSTQSLRDNNPPDQQITFSEKPLRARTRTGNLLFDGLYAMAVSESLQNSVPEVSDSAYNGSLPIPIEAYQTGEKWTYVWTRDLAYALYLGLAAFDPERAVNSLLFKSSALKATVKSGEAEQILQDMGSGGSYPVSTDRVVWALGAHETLKHLSGSKRAEFLKKIHPILCGTIEQDRVLAFDPKDGLYRGEHSFLDWREQSYPARTKDNVLPIAMSKALSVNAANYHLLKMAADYSLVLAKPHLHTKYSAWAEELKAAINRHFFDTERGLYRTYLFSDDGSVYLPSARYDLLGGSLAVLVGIADLDRAEQVVQNYPTGPFGPPVLWPQEASVDIYHNQGIWPFVTAFGIKAARKTGNVAVVEAGVFSLYRQASLNLSNMENFDFITGLPYANDGVRQGPVINSRRQLWSVAAYLSMVQNILFGFESSWEGMRFLPAITAGLCRDLFASSRTIELRELIFRETKHRVRIHLPEGISDSEGFCLISKTLLNEELVTGDFVSMMRLKKDNIWEIFLAEPPAGLWPQKTQTADLSNPQAVFAPLQPQWKGEGIESRKGRLVLRYTHPEQGKVLFNIYRDGMNCAQGLDVTEWTDIASAHYADHVHVYHVEAFYPGSKLVSHPTEGRSYRSMAQEKIIPAMEMKNEGPALFTGKHFEKWGQPEEVILTKFFKVTRSGHYRIRLEFSNGSGPVPTGITCAVKKLELIKGPEAAEVSGYLVLPQSGDWTRWDLSPGLEVFLDAGSSYRLRLSEDSYCRNMSYMEKNESYSAHAGGGKDPYNHINIASLRLLFVSV